MAQSYKATAKQNPGRKAWLVEFRHPLRTDANNKPGKKIRKGLGTEDAQEAHRLVEQLTQLLADQSLWSVGAQAEAAKRYDGKVVEIFYSEIAPRAGLPLNLRDKLLPLPSRQAENYARVALMGVPGAGKTTLVRQLIGTDPETERFPSTSANRTTTFPTEIAMRENGGYEAVVTFMSEHETRFEIEESLSSAVVEAVDGDIKKVARALLEKSDMRFRLKYLLGDLVQESDAEIDPYNDEESVETKGLVAGSGVTAEEAAQNQKTLAGYIGRVVDLAKRLKTELETGQGPIETMPAEDRSAALDLIEEQAATSDEFLELVSDILEELRAKFEPHVTGGQFEKTTTGWPNAWSIKAKDAERESFLKSVRFFSGISYQSWGKLLTPLVNGLRVVGPFKPIWAEKAARLVLIDTEGLGHKSNETTDLPEQVLSMFHDADVILLVESAKNGMTNFAVGKALEGVVNTGHTRKLAVVFTHMDEFKDDTRTWQAKIDHVFGGLRNVVDNQLAKNVSAEAARHLLDHLGKSTFYVGRIDKPDPTPARPMLLKLLEHLSFAQPKFQLVSFPEYSPDNLVLAIQEAAKEFRQQWRGFLGLAGGHAEFKPKPWQTLKALTRRYAEGWGNGFVLQPTSNLIAALSSAISRFLETPIGWSGNPTQEQKRETIDRIKTAVTKQLQKLSTRRLREQPQPVWKDAYVLRGAGSTFDRRMRIEGIYERWVPIPDARGSQLVYEFLKEVKEVVIGEVDAVKQKVPITTLPPPHPDEPQEVIVECNKKPLPAPPKE